MRSIPVMGCVKTFAHQQPECPEAIAVRECLLPSTDYRWTIKDKFGHHYVGFVTSDAEGNISIPVDSDFPEGMFMHFSGSFLLTVERYASATDVHAVPFEIGGIQYGSIELSFFSTNNPSAFV